MTTETDSSDEAKGLQYKTGPVPVNYHEASGDVVHQIPFDITEEFGIEDRDYARVVPEVDAHEEEVVVTVYLEDADQEDSPWANRRRFRRVGDNSATLTYPVKLASVMQLQRTITSDGEDLYANVTAHPSEPNALRIAYDPMLEPWRGESEDPTAVTGLDLYKRSLVPNGDGVQSVETAAPRDVEAYRVDFPWPYVDYYELEHGAEAVLRLGHIYGQTALVIDWGVDPNAYPSGIVRPVQKYNKGNWEWYGEKIEEGMDEETAAEKYLSEATAVYLSKPILHALDLGVDRVDPEVYLVPGPDWIAIIKDEPTSVTAGNILDRAPYRR